MRLYLPMLIGASLVLAACGGGMPPASAAPTAVPPTGGPTPGHLPHVDWLGYHDDTAGFSIQFPLTWRRQGNPGYPVVYSLPAAPGTNLIEKRLEINVSQNAGECRQSTYNIETESAPPSRVIVNGTDFLKEAGLGIAAGNLYDWTSYSTAKGLDCITLTFVLHSSSSGVYATEPAPFDKAAESGIFDEILNTFKFDP